MRKYWNIIKWITGVGLVLLLVCGGGAAFLVPMIKKQMDAQRERAMGALVVVEPAMHGSLVRTVSAPGTVAAKTTTNISARVSAKINSIHADEGQKVNEGDLLISLDSLEWVASLDAAKARFAGELASLKSIESNLAAEEARLVGSRANYNNAMSEFERQQSLFASGDVSQQSLDNARTEVDRTQSAYNAAQKNLEAVKANVEAARARGDASKAEVDRAQRNVDYCTIKAPFAGLITRRIAQVGETALGTVQNTGTQLMVLEDTSEMLVKARLAETDAPRVSPGQKVRIFINGYPDEQFDGVVRKVGMTSLRWQADNTYYFEAEVVIDPKTKRLSTGTTANVDIEIETIADVLMVPSQAVLDKRIDSLSQKLREESPLVDREKTFARLVMLYKDGKVVYTPVKTIAANINSTAISEGIEDGAPVIVGPFSALQTLADGAKVRTEKDTDKAKGDKKKAEETAVAEKDGASKEEKPADQTKGDEKKKSETGGATKSAAAS